MNTPAPGNRTCPMCGYSLRGHSGEIVCCPECGEHVSQRELDEFETPLTEHQKVMGRSVSVTLLTTLGAVSGVAMTWGRPGFLWFLVFIPLGCAYGWTTYIRVSEERRGRLRWLIALQGLCGLAILLLFAGIWALVRIVGLLWDRGAVASAVGIPLIVATFVVLAIAVRRWLIACWCTAWARVFPPPMC